MDLTFQVPMQYCSLQHLTLLSPSDTSVTGCPSCFGSASSCFLEVFLCSSLDILDTYQPRGFHLSVSYLLHFHAVLGFSRKNTKVVCHSLLQWATFCQNSTPCPVHLGWPYMAWLIVSLSETRLWSVWLLFCDCGFHSVCPLMEKFYIVSKNKTRRLLWLR